MRAGGDGHDAVADVRQQEVRQRERTEVVRADLQLEAVGGAPARHGHDARVVDEDVQRLVPRGGEGAHRREVGEVQAAHLCRAVHRRGGGLAALGVADGEHDAGAGARELARRHGADAAVGAGDDRRAAGHVGQVGRGPARGGHHSKLRPPRRVAVPTTQPATLPVQPVGFWVASFIVR